MKKTTELPIYYYKDRKIMAGQTFCESAFNTVRVVMSNCTCGKEVFTTLVKKYRTKKIIGKMYLCPDCYEICKPEEKGDVELFENKQSINV